MKIQTRRKAKSRLGLRKKSCQAGCAGLGGGEASEFSKVESLMSGRTQGHDSTAAASIEQARVGLRPDTRRRGAENVAAALLLDEGDNAQICSLPSRVQFRFLLSREGGSCAAVCRANFVEPAHDGSVVQIFAGIFAASHRRMQGGLRNGQPNLRRITSLSALKLGNRYVEKCTVSLF